MMTDKYILQDKVPVPCSDPIEWGQWCATADRRVALDYIGDVRISTVFLGLNHRFAPGPPLLFETMIFGGAHDEYQQRCASWDEAEKQHEAAVALVQSAAGKDTGR